MAVYWNLGLLARDPDSAAACMAFFAAQPLVVGGANIPLEVSACEVPGGWLVGVWPRGMNHGSPHGSNHALTSDEARATIAAAFDAWLRDAPPFAVALFAAEAYDSFLDGLADLTQGFAGVVCDEQQWRALGCPPEAVRIADDRHAWPRTGVP